MTGDGQHFGGQQVSGQDLGGHSLVDGLMNNCYRDYAQVNARQLADLLAAQD